jgi:hypothetical protein
MNYPVIGWGLQSKSVQLARVPDATQYAVGDILTSTPSNWISFPNPLRPGATRGRITGAECTVECSTGTIALPSFDLLIFEPAANIPFAAGSVPADNAALNISAAAYRNNVCILRFSDTGWRNSAGGSTASGTVLFQIVSMPLQAAGRPYAITDMTGTPANELRGLIQMQNTFNPGAVGYTFDFTLDVDSD